LFEIEAIAGLIPINLHLHKLSCCAQLYTYSLSHNHILWSLLESQPFEDIKQHPIPLNSLTHCQRGIIKGSIVDINNKFNEVFPSFDPLNIEFSPNSCLIDIFPSCFSFHPYIKQKENNLENCAIQLNDITTSSLLNHLHALIILDTGIKNNVAMSISHIHICDRPIVKMVHHATNITTTEAKLFAIRCGINQAVNLPEILKIIIIMDSIHVARSIFDSSIHPFQVHSAVISKELRKFFLTNNNNSIEFWEYPSCCNWSFFKFVGKDTK